MRAMYLRRIQIQNLKRIRDLTLDIVDAAGQPRMWTVLIGENGTAKTSILHAMGLAAAGAGEANGLASRIVAHLRDRREPDDLRIHADFAFTKRSLANKALHPELHAKKQAGDGLRSTLELQGKATSFARPTTRAHYVDRRGKEIISKRDPLEYARSVHTPLWFVAGYGVARGFPDAQQPTLDRPSIDRLKPLFGPVELASTGFANHFLRKDIEEGRNAGTTSRIYAKMLNQAIRLGGPDLLPDIQKLELRGRGGTKSQSDLIESDRFHQRMGSTTHPMPAVALSHGYQSTFAWIADLIGHVLLESKTEIGTTEMEGLVLLDEIDLYLHPLWQASFITGLRRVFPRMQFIATTHSPVVLADLEPGEIVRLHNHPETGNVECAERGGDPRSMTGSEIYREWFGVDRLTPNPHGEALRTYVVLAGDPFRSAEDEAELRRLEKKLDGAGITKRPAPVGRRRS